jgi:hypothetical protein
MPVRSVVLWQPVMTGKAVVTDLLRARIAAASATGGRETVNGLRQQLAAGCAVEAAGYELAPELARELDRAVVAPEPGVPLPPICWMEVAASDGSATRQAAVDTVGRLRAAGTAVELMRQQDPPFWGTTEITTGQNTELRTVAWLADTA